jgi:hypothetical protein
VRFLRATHFRNLVERYQQQWRKEQLPRRDDDPQPRKKVSTAELQAMVCCDGKWYANERELEKAVAQKKDQAESQPWAIPDGMLKPKPRKALVRSSKKRWIV